MHGLKHLSPLSVIMIYRIRENTFIQILRYLASWILMCIYTIFVQLIDGAQIYLARAQQVACVGITE